MDLAALRINTDGRVADLQPLIHHSADFGIKTLLFPLLILYEIMLPLDAGPGWRQVLARFDPMTYIVEAERHLLGGNLMTAEVLWGVVAAAPSAAIGLVAGIRKTRTTT